LSPIRSVGEGLLEQARLFLLTVAGDRDPEVHRCLVLSHPETQVQATAAGHTDGEGDPAGRMSEQRAPMLPAPSGNGHHAQWITREGRRSRDDGHREDVHTACLVGLGYDTDPATFIP
jgi:hypothetical protein